MENRELFDQKRFYLSKSEQSYFLYDSFTGDYFYYKTIFEVVNKMQSLSNIIEYKTNFERTQNHIFKLNLSTMCNMNCSYCFRDKSSNIKTDVQKAQRMIDCIFQTYAPEINHYSFSLNMTSESTVELDKIIQIKNYLDKKAGTFFTSENFTSEENALEYLKCFPPSLVKDFSEFKTIEQIKNKLNQFLLKRNLKNYFPLPQGINLPQWEQEQYDKTDTLSQSQLALFNLRFLEFLFPDVFKKRKSYSLFICTNGTFYSKKLLDFYNQINMNTICISMDGPSSVHNKNRIFNDNTSTHKIVLENINKFMDEGKKISISTVLTKDYPYPNLIANYFREIGITNLDMKPVRAGTDLSFNTKTIFKLLDGYKKLYEQILSEIKSGNYSLVELLKDDICFAGIKLLIGKNRLIKRCGWDEETVIDDQGNIYPCDYTIGKKDFIRGNIFTAIKRTELKNELFVNSRYKCKDCWARYLCGGTCYYNSLVNNGNIFIPDETECIFQKGLRELNINFLHKLFDNKINIYSFAKRLGLNINDNISFEKEYFIANGIEKNIKGTLSRIEIEIKRMYNYIYKHNIKTTDEMYFSVTDVESKDSINILNARVILPASNINGKIKGYKHIKNLTFNNCISGSSLSNQKDMERMKQQIIQPVRDFKIPLASSFWYKGSLRAIMGHSNELIECFVQEA